MRRIQIKIWPEIESDYPALIPTERISKTKINPIDVDFTNTYSVNSSGLNILLINLIKSFSEIESRKWDMLESNDNSVNNFLTKSNFISNLINNVPNNNIFWIDKQKLPVFNEELIENKMDYFITKFPIYEIDFGKFSSRREGLNDFKEFVVSKLFYLVRLYNFELNILISILMEMAKNSADHTSQKAFFGMDTITYKNKVILKFSFGDLGIGINNSVRKFMQSNEKFLTKAAHLAITDSYHFAFTLGKTTKPHSLENKGIGMSTIFSLAKLIKLKLSVYDAQSRGLLTQSIDTSHIELRKIFYNTGFKVGFYYFGEIEMLHL